MPLAARSSLSRLAGPDGASRHRIHAGVTGLPQNRKRVELGLAPFELTDGQREIGDR